MRFSLHAGTLCQPRERDSLERLCRSIARLAVSNERLSVNDRGQVVYRLKHSFHDGTTHVVLDPVDFIARLGRPYERRRTDEDSIHPCEVITGFRLREAWLWLQPLPKALSALKVLGVG